MYLRFPIIADLCSEVLYISKTELATQLYVSPSTLSQYRNSTRYPRGGEASHVRHALAALLSETGFKLNPDNFIMTCMSFDENLSSLSKNHAYFELGTLAAEICYKIIMIDKNKNTPTGKEVLLYLQKQDTKKVPEILIWLMRNYCKTLVDNTPYIFIKRIEDFLSVYETKKINQRSLSIPAPFYIDVLMCATKEIQFNISIESTDHNRKIIPYIKITDINDNVYSIRGKENISYPASEL